MPGDYSRKTFNKTKHYSGVSMQQGRVQLDADWNEQLDIEQYRTFTETKDVIGAAGVPKKNGGFKIIVSADGSDLVIEPGRIYLEGLLCELEPGTITTYKNQPYYPGPDVSDFNAPGSPPGSPVGSPPVAKLKDGSYVVYLKAWQREINYLDDPYIQEKALGEADTTTRLQTVWQVKLLKVQDNGSGKCSSSFPEWDALTAPFTGLLNAQTKKPEDNKNPCVLPPNAGYLRLENQLYRVQVQKVNAAKKATSFTWSRDNASIETIIENVSGKVLTVSDIGKDDVLGFSGNQWVEMVDDISTLNGIPYPLLQIDSINPDSRKITLKTDATAFAGKKGLKLRRWDQGGVSATPDGLPVSAGWMDIEDGIQVMFDNGTFEPGDFWLIPARTATGNIEWPHTDPGLIPIAQPRNGTSHFYCRLAFVKVQNGAVVVQEDCRNLFPSLTDIEECDLKEHNKYLHGHGVVCGLKVKCGLDRNRVIIETGYALDCEGNAIKNKSAIDFNVMAAVANTNLLNAGNGVVCLTIGYNGTSQPIINVEPFVKQKLLDEILEGTLLKDFLDGCIKSLINALKADLKYGPQAVPVPVEQRRLTALINLLAQMINPKSQQYAFISGDNTKKHNLAQCIGGNLADKDEDNLLYCFYEKLKTVLASETYCAQFDHQTFPEYTIDPGLNTIFGTPLKTHRRLRVDADGEFAYTCKDNHQVYVYDLRKEEFVNWFDFPAPNVQVQDVCVSKNGKELFVVGTSGNDSVFGIVSSGTSANPGTWKGPFTVNGLKFTTLAMDVQKGTLFGIAKANGFYQIKLSNSSVQVKQLSKFNATGLMVTSDDNNQLAFAAEDKNTPVGTESTSFSVINVMNLSGNVLNTTLINGNDSLNDMIYNNDSVYVTGDGPVSNPSMRILARFRAVNAAGGNNPIISTTLEVTTEVIRLALVRQNADIDAVLVSFSDQSKVLRVSSFPGKLEMEKGYRIPVQLFPMDIATGNVKREKVYVLNTFVNTITAIDVNKVILAAARPNFTQDPPDAIVDYREEVLAAYKGLFKNLLQYLKDCFCDKFLIDCPDCDEKDKVYLGTIEIRDSQIYHICNFTKRKYVKTFRSVEYWLSVIPILPLFKKAFTAFCCWVIGSKMK